MISRKDFLKLSGLAAGLALQTAAWPGKRWLKRLEMPLWPSISVDTLPERLQRYLRIAPKCEIGADGRMVVLDPPRKTIDRLPPDETQKVIGKSPLVLTEWNMEHNHSWDRLYGDISWGIVLHWFSEKKERYSSLQSYLNGFNGLREVDGYQTRTSAHFLIGDARPVGEDSEQLMPIGILQMQAPDKDGTPFVASHIQPLNYLQHQNKEQYFVRALYQLSYLDSSVHSILQDFYDGRHIDPNMRTLAVEICGDNFDIAGNRPSDQKIANVLAVVWALMQRYNIRASNLLGHNEISTSNPDPGKKFMALLRLLIGAKALVTADQRMKDLVFGQHLTNDRQPAQAIQTYFQFVRDYLVLVSLPVEVYSWERESLFWFVDDLVRNTPTEPLVAASFRHPFQESLPNPTSAFMVPPFHEGVDLMQHGSLALPTGVARLAAPGTCLFVGESLGFHGGQLVIFRHRQPDGAMVLSVYGLLDRLANIQAGKVYPAGEALGTASRNLTRENILHFAIGYGATWETDLRANANIPLNAGITWIQQRYLEPVQFLGNHSEKQERLGWPSE